MYNFASIISGCDPELDCYCAVLAARRWGINVHPYIPAVHLVLKEIAEGVEAQGGRPEELARTIMEQQIVIVETRYKNELSRKVKDGRWVQDRGDGFFQNALVVENPGGGGYDYAAAWIEFQEGGAGSGTADRKCQIVWRGSYGEYIRQKPQLKSGHKEAKK